MEYSYYGGYLDESIKPKRNVVYFMLEQYIKQKVDKEVDRLVDLIENKINKLSINSIMEIKMIRSQVNTLAMKIAKKADKSDKTIFPKFEDGEPIDAE